MSAVVHHECTVGLLLFDECSHVGIGVARRGGHLGVGIPHHPFQHESQIKRVNHQSSFVGILHVQVVVAVVAHEHHHVLPRTGVGILGIADGLVNHHLGLGSGAHGEASHGNVVLVGAGRPVTFAVVETAEIAVVHVAAGRAERVLALIAEQQIVGRNVFHS